MGRRQQHSSCHLLQLQQQCRCKQNPKIPCQVHSRRRSVGHSLQKQQQPPVASHLPKFWHPLMATAKRRTRRQRPQRWRRGHSSRGRDDGLAPLMANLADCWLVAVSWLCCFCVCSICSTGIRKESL